MYSATICEILLKIDNFVEMSMKDEQNFWIKKSGINNSFRAISNFLHISLSAIVPNCPGDVSGVEARMSGVFLL